MPKETQGIFLRLYLKSCAVKRTRKFISNSKRAISTPNLCNKNYSWLVCLRENDDLSLSRANP